MIDLALPSTFSFPTSFSGALSTPKNTLRPLIEVVKMTSAIIEGALKGSEHALHSLSHTGAPLAIVSAMTAYSLNSGRKDSSLRGPLELLHIPIQAILHVFPSFPLLSWIDSQIDPCIDSSPQTWFYGALIKGALLHEFYDHPFNFSEIDTRSLKELNTELLKVETKLIELKKSEILLNELLKSDYISFQKEIENTKTAIQEKEKERKNLLNLLEERSSFADEIEKLVLSKNLVLPMDFPDYTPTAVKISKWSSGIFTMAAFGLLLHYALDTHAYENHTFSEYVNGHFLQPVTSFLRKPV